MPRTSGQECCENSTVRSMEQSSCASMQRHWNVKLDLLGVCYTVRQ